MSNGKKLSGKDYLMWFITIIAFFLFFLWIGDFGNLGYLTQGPITEYVRTLWYLTYIAAGGVFGVFMGSIVFLAIRFRAPTETSQERKVTTTITYYYTALLLDLVLLIVINYEIFTMSSYEFITGLLASADFFLLGSAIYLVYKLYYEK